MLIYVIKQNSYYGNEVQTSLLKAFKSEKKAYEYLKNLETKLGNKTTEFEIETVEVEDI